MRIFSGILFASFVLAPPLLAAPSWHRVSHTAKPQGYYIPQPVTVRAEQATLMTEREGITRWYGYSGPTNLHTRNLRFTFQGVVYPVPQPFVGDLLWLYCDRPGRASVDGKDVVFTMTGCDGEKGYTVYFHFREGRFFQRILAYTEAQEISIRTNDA